MLLENAIAFTWMNARLLKRTPFEHLFSGSPAKCVGVLPTCQNPVAAANG